MKLTKRFLSLLFLVGHASALAMVPCSGPCDAPRPDFKCRKKVNACKVDTDGLLVRQNENVCGDLTVNGSVNNLELQLLQDTAVPPTDEVYNEYRLFPGNFRPILENIQEFSFPISTVVPGTEIYPDAPIYGYNVETQELILGGGPALSYTPGFDVVNTRYHGQNPNELLLTTPENMEGWMERAYSYLAQRGFPLPGPDIYPEYEGQFLGTQNGIQGVAIKFHYGDPDSLVPTALDLAASSDQVTVLAINLYEPDQSLRQNGHYYPIRIPITTDLNIFKALYCIEPIVYFNNSRRTITIHVPESNDPSRLMVDLLLSVSCCSCDTSFATNNSLTAFDGSFSLMRRTSSNQLVSASFADVEYLIQSSAQVTVTNESTLLGTVTNVYDFSAPGDVFTGLAIPLMNGGSPANDVYTFTFDVLGAVSFESDPYILPSLEDGTQIFAQGDNPFTTVTETLGSPVANTFYDNVEWFYAYLTLPLNVLMGQTTPEENGDVPLADFANPSILLCAATGHEFLHNSQFLQGTISFLPTEGQALGLNLDPALNNALFCAGFQDAWAAYLTRMIQGNWPLTLPEYAANINEISTYGSSIFWRYLATQFDYNYQVMRRMSDILSHETLNPLLEANNIPFDTTPEVYGLPIGTNPAGSLLALDQSLQELHGLNVQDVFSNFAVSLAMLRNNSSIPEEYRHMYPYWLNSETYPDYEFISSFLPGYATWWDGYQENNNPALARVSTIPAISATPFTAYYTANGPRLSSTILAQGEIANPPGACTTVTNDLTGKIGIVVKSPACNSSTLVLRTEAAGSPIAATLIIDTIDNPGSYGGNPAQTRPAVAISQVDGESLLNALEINPTLTIVLEPAPFMPTLTQDVQNVQVQDMTMLLYEVPQDVSSVTVDVLGEWRISAVQFNSDGTPVGEFIMSPNSGPVAVTDGQVVIDMTPFTGAGQIRLVCAHVSMPTYDGLSSWCGFGDLTGNISITRN